MSPAPRTSVHVDFTGPLAKRARAIATAQGISLGQLVREVVGFIADEVNQVGHVASAASRLALYREAFEVNRAALKAAFDLSMAQARAATEAFTAAQTDAERFAASCSFDQAYRTAAKIAGAPIDPIAEARK